MLSEEQTRMAMDLRLPVRPNWLKAYEGGLVKGVVGYRTNLVPVDGEGWFADRTILELTEGAISTIREKHPELLELFGLVEQKGEAK